MNLNFTCSFTFNTKQNYFSTLLPAILPLFIKNGSHTVDEEQAVFEQYLGNFKKCSSTALRMTNYSCKIKISWVWCFFSPLLIFELIQQASLLWCISYCFQIFPKSGKSSFKRFEKKCISLVCLPCGLLKSYVALRHSANSHNWVGLQTK